MSSHSSVWLSSMICRAQSCSGSAVDYSRKLWTLLVFMIWHGIFVEERITPAVPETVYPVRL